MPNTDIIDEVVSSEAYKRVVEFKDAMDQLEKKFITTAQAADAANSAISGSKGIKEVIAATEKLNIENEQLSKVEKQLSDLAAKRAIAESKLGQELATNKILLQQTNKENANRAKIDQTNAGSISRMEAVVVRLRAAQRGLNLETEEGAKKNDLYRKSIDFLNDRIKANSDKAKQQSLNVGNYQGSAKIIVEALEKEQKKLEELQAKRISVQNAGASPLTPAASGNFNVGRTTISGFSRGNDLTALDKQIEQTQKNLTALNNITSQPAFLNLAGKVGDSTREFKTMQKALIELERNGFGNTEGAVKLRKELAEMKDQIADTKEEIKAMSSDTRKLDLFAGTVSFAADTFQTFAGAARLAGASEQDAAEATATLTAIQSVANGVKGIANELTTRGTAANKLFAFSQKQMNIVMEEGIFTMKGLKAALITTGFGALIILLGYAIANFDKLKRVITGTTAAQEAMNTTVKDYQEGAKSAVETTLKVQSAFQQAKEGVISKHKALEIYNTTLGDTLGKAKSLDEAETIYNKKAEGYIKIMALKAQANAYFALSAAETAKVLTAKNEDQTGLWDKTIAGLKEFFVRGSSIPGMLEAQAEGVKNVTVSAKQNAEDLANAGINISKEMSEIAAKLKINDETDIAMQKKAADEAKKAAEARKKIQEALAKFNEKQLQEEDKALQVLSISRIKKAGDVFKSIADDEKKSMQDRLLANGFYYGTLEKDILNKQQFEKDALISTVIAEKEQILKRKLNQSEIEDIYRQVNGQLVTIEQKAQADIVAIHRQGIEDQNKIIETGTAQKLDSLAKRSSIEISGINKAESEALAALEYQYNQKLISQEQYETERAKIVADFAGKRLQSELDTAIVLLDIIKATGQDVTDQEAKIAAIRLKIAQNLTAGLKAENGQQEADDKAVAERKKELWNELGMELKESVFSFIDSGFERQKNALEREKIVIDERKDAEIKRINSLQIAESEKADKIKLLDATVQAQKEQLARKQKQIDAKKAKADKVAAIFGIGINIAQREVEALSYLTNPATAAAYPFIAALIGAIGAVQLAAVIAKPIPEYWTGTKDSGEAGLAIVGDKRGKELVKLQDGSVYETPSTSTLINLPAHSEVISNPDYQKILNSQYFYSMNKGGEPFKERQFFEWQSKLAEENTDRVVQAIKDKPETVWNIDPWGISSYKKQGHSWNEYMDKKVRFKKN